MATGRRDFEGALGGFLGFYVPHVRMLCSCFHDSGDGPPQELRALEVVDQRQDVQGRQNVDIPGPRGLRALRGGADQPLISRRCVDRGRQNAVGGRECPVQRDFAESGVFLEPIALNDPHGREKPERNGQVVMAALLGEIRRRQVHGDPSRGQRQPERLQRGADALAGFADGLVGQTDDGEGGEPCAHLHLDIDVHDVHALECNRVHVRRHARPEVVRGPIISL